MKNNQSILEQKSKENMIQEQVELLDAENKVKSTGLEFDFEHADRFWEAKYGIIQPPILLRERGTKKLYDNKKWKAILQNDDFINQVGRYYVLYPNEEVVSNTNDLVKADPTLKLLQERGVPNPRFTNHGLNMFMTLISEEHSFKVKDSHEVGDLIQVGVMIRNSMGGGMGLGADLFTYRLGCLNGAVFRSFDLGNDYMRHYGKDVAKVTNAMRDLINNSLSRVEDVKNFYEKMATKKLGDNNRMRIMKQLENAYLPQRYFPDYVEIEDVKISKDEPSDKVYRIPSEAKSYSMWRVFNDFTQKVWHSKDIRLDAKRKYTVKLHQIIIDALKDSKVN
jgi:hypothetical protein